MARLFDWTSKATLQVNDLLPIYDVNGGLDKKITASTLANYVQQDSGFNLKIENNDPEIFFIDSDGTANSKKYKIKGSGNKLSFTALNDAETTETEVFTYDDSGLSINELLTVSGSGITSSTGTINTDSNINISKSIADLIVESTTDVASEIKLLNTVQSYSLLTAGSGGSYQFRLVDNTNSKIPFTAIPNAPTSSLVLGLSTVSTSQPLTVNGATWDGNSALQANGIISTDTRFDVGASAQKSLLSDTSLEIGFNRTTDGSVRIDLAGDTTYSDYGLRIIRNGGANAGSSLIHRGTGNLRLTTIENSGIILEGGSGEYATFSTNNVNLFKPTLINGATWDGSSALQVVGDADIDGTLTMQDEIFTFRNYSATTVTESTIFSNISSWVPNVGDAVSCSGQIRQSSSGGCIMSLERTLSSVIKIGIKAFDSNAIASFSITSSGSGTYDVIEIKSNHNTTSGF